MCVSVFLLLLAAVGLSSFAATENVMMVEEAVQKHLLLVAAKPTYSYEARSRGRTGRGLFELKFDYETGRLREVHVVKSFGDRLLDGPTIGALKVWQAKPRSIHTLLVPVRFG
jgi:outer membrane biosynthesis protein TonB